MEDPAGRVRDAFAANLARGWAAPVEGVVGGWDGALPHDVTAAEANADGTVTLYGRDGASRWDPATAALVEMVDAWRLPSAPRAVLPDPEVAGGRVAITEDGHAVRWPSGRAERRWATYVRDARPAGGGRFALVRRDGADALYELPSWRVLTAFRGKVLGVDDACERFVLDRGAAVALCTRDGEALRARSPGDARRAFVRGAGVLLHAGNALYAWAPGGVGPARVWSSRHPVRGAALAVPGDDAVLVTEGPERDDRRLELVLVGADGRERRRMAVRVFQARAWGARPLAVAAGRCLVGDGARVVAVDLRDGRATASSSGHDDVVTALAHSRDGGALATAARDGTVRVWRVADGRCLLALEDDGVAVTAAAFAPGGRALYTAGADDRVRVWNLADGAVERRVAAPPRVRRLRTSRDGSAVALVSDRRARVLAGHGGAASLCEVGAPQSAAHFDAAFGDDGALHVLRAADVPPAEEGPEDVPGTFAEFAPVRYEVTAAAHDPRDGRPLAERALGETCELPRLSEHGAVAWLLRRAAEPWWEPADRLARVDLATGEERSLAIPASHVVIAGDAVALVFRARPARAPALVAVRLRDGELVEGGVLWEPAGGDGGVAPTAASLSLSPDERELVAVDASGVALRFALS